MLPHFRIIGLTTHFRNGAELCHGEPKLIRGVKHVQGIENSVMRDQTPETVCLALDVVHHVASKGSTYCTTAFD